MKTENRIRIVGVRFTTKEYEQIEKKWKDSTCRKLSEYVRKIIFNQPIVATYRNKSLDDNDRNDSAKKRVEWHWKQL